MTGIRLPHQVFAVGDDPDPRFSLANERTALAWMRSGMSVIAAGVALAVYAHASSSSVWIRIGAIVACLAGSAIALWALRRWEMVETALRLRQSMPAPSLLFVIPLATIPLVILVIAFALGAFSG